MLMAKRKYVCKHCKIEVLGPKDTRPVLGKTHKKSCPRRRIQG
jgi:hypothetical protein